MPAFFIAFQKNGYLTIILTRPSMKLAYSIKQKTKIAFLLFLIMACTILIRLLEDRSIQKMEKAFTSLYNDRLIPATDIFYLSEKLYAKRFLLETFVHNDQNTLSVAQLSQKLKVYDQEIDVLLQKYEQTFLVKNEQNHLADLKTKLAENRKLEKNMLRSANQLGKSQLRMLFDTDAEQSFTDISAILFQLTKIQTVVGQQLKTDSQKIVMGTNLYSTLQLILAIVIGILIVSIIFASNVINVRNEKFNWN
jgi:hypothetical protein